MNILLMYLVQNMVNKIEHSKHTMQNIDHTELKHNQFNDIKHFFDKFNYINNEKIVKSIMLLKEGSSLGLDGITVKLLKLNINSLIRPLSQNFNLSISFSNILDSFKISIISPIYIKGEIKHRKLSSYPQLSNVAKI